MTDSLRGTSSEKSFVYIMSCCKGEGKIHLLIIDYEGKLILKK